MLAVAAVVSCRGGSAPVAPVDCTGRTDATRVPLTELTRGCYLEYSGGLYPGGNDIPAPHLAAGRAAAAQVVPRDPAGTPAAGGRYVLLSIGMSNTTQE